MVQINHKGRCEEGPLSAVGFLCVSVGSEIFFL